MSIKSRCQINVIAPKQMFASYLAYAITFTKNRTTVIYEYDVKDMPEVLKLYNKEPNEPCLVVSEGVASGINTISKFLDSRYPVPRLDPGDPTELIQRSQLFDALYKRFNNFLEELKSDWDMEKMLASIAKEAEIIDLSIREEAKSLQYDPEQPTSLQCLFIAFQLMCDDIELDLSRLSHFKLFTLYMNSVKKLPGYVQAHDALTFTRENEAFYEKPDFDIAPYVAPYKEFNRFNKRA